ncbi:glycoside hydrolase domain-containing protein [Oceanobacillus massiliensis]|uniref:glycoside hydrolase domain-containing protein n=1 Tax=Oceanobacillus massiliensis TaxID=1465765 RepID=UPI0002891412|nr:glycoside hydrolase domain-containing protein [Oceanobacillus massiliensis]
MEKNNELIMLGIVILLAIPFMFFLMKFNPPADLVDNEDNDSSTNGVIWGVDSASYTDDTLYACVQDNFGQPKVWGRYLGNKEGVSAGMDTDEIRFLHDNDIQILVIYNHMNDVTGFENGEDHAEQAITLAEDLNIPDGVAIFADIEPDYPVDSEFMKGWYETLSASVYAPAIYGVFNEDSELYEAYNTLDETMQEDMIIWTAYPQEEITTEENAPDYNPQGPENSMLYGWQYAIDAETCNIDTNLFSEEMADYLW